MYSCESELSQDEVEQKIAQKKPALAVIQGGPDFGHCIQGALCICVGTKAGPAVFTIVYTCVRTYVRTCVQTIVYTCVHTYTCVRTCVRTIV